MKLLPHRRFTIETRLTPSQVEARLRDAVEPPRSFSFSKPERPLVGTVDAPTFDVMRNVYGRNSFRPRVRGRIEAAGRGTRLSGTMQLHEIVMLFMGAFFTVASTAFLAMAVRNLQSRQLEPATLIALGVVVFLGGMTTMGFIPETRKALDELGRVVDASHGELR